MVAMFRYSSVIMYIVSMPPQKLEFSGAIREEWIFKETENVSVSYLENYFFGFYQLKLVIFE